MIVYNPATSTDQELIISLIEDGRPLPRREQSRIPHACANGRRTVTYGCFQSHPARTQQPAKLLPRLTQAWLVACWMTVSPALRCTTGSSSIQINFTGHDDDDSRPFRVRCQRGCTAPAGSSGGNSTTPNCVPFSGGDMPTDLSVVSP